MRVEKLGNLVSITGGGTPDRSNPSFWGGDVPWVTVKDFKSLEITGATEHITTAGLEGSASNLIAAGTIIVPTRMALGKAAINTKPVAINQDLKALRIVDPTIVYRDYLFRFLLSKSSYLESQGKGATVKGITLDVLRELDVPLRPKKEQQRIATILDKADSLRCKRREAIRLVDKFLQAAYIKILGDPAKNNDRWPIFELGELVESTKLGLVRSSEEFGWDLPTPYLRMDAITNDGKVLHDRIKGTRATLAEIADFGLKRGDLLFNTRNSRELVGKTALWDGPDGTVFNNNIMRIRFKNSIAPQVVAMQFRLPTLKRELESRKSGTTSVFAIYYKDLKTLPIQVPPEAAQEKFARIAQQTRIYIAKVDAMAKEAETLSLALSHRFFG